MKKKKPAVTDDDLFGNTDDIFGNVPKDTSKLIAGKSKKAKSGVKGKKKKKASSAAKVAATAEVSATTTTEPTTDEHDGVVTTHAGKLESTTETSAAPTKGDDFEGKFY